MTDLDLRRRRAAPTRPSWGRLAWLYALAIAYVSLVLGPEGFNFVPRDPVDALRAFVAMPYFVHGSDQRQDWMANLIMFAGLGFLLAAARTGSAPTRAGPLVASLLIAVAFLLAVKYAQLFFPPRTVSINYVVAQGLGAALGVAAFALLRRRVTAVLDAIATGGRPLLLAVLALYGVGLLFFMVFPFDFALSAADLRDRLRVLPRLLTDWPGAGRSLPLRILLCIASVAMTVPLGLWLRLALPRRSTGALLAVGTLTMAAVTLATLFVLSATPQLASLALRSLGILLGLRLGAWLERGGVAGLLPGLRRSVPALAVAFLAAVLAVKDVAGTDLLSLDAALAQFDARGLVPLWHHYIVSKSHAVRSLAVHVALFAPIGVMVWLRLGSGRGAAWLAGGLGMALGLGVEIGRGFRPGLQADITNALIAAAVAAGAVRLSPPFWRMLTARRDGAPHGAPAAAVAVEVEPVREPWPAPPDAVAREPGPPPLSPPRAALGHWLVAASAAAIAVALILAYPLSRPLLAAVAGAVAALLWRRPTAWPIVVPALLGAVDLMPWSGWILASESDVLIAAAIAVMTVRRPPALRDLRLPAPATLTLAALAATTIIGLAIGLTSHVEGFTTSANPYLHPANAWRVSKGVLLGLVLLPFLRSDWLHEPALPARLAAGFTLALAIVAAIGIAERAMFVPLLDFDIEYRIVGPFTAMHLGGSQLAIFLVLALPFALGLLASRRGPRALAILVVLTAGFFALAVTYTRAAYGAVLIALVGFAIAAIAARRAQRRTAAGPGAQRVAAGTLGALLAVVAGAAALMAAGAGLMGDRLRDAGSDLGARLHNWQSGLALRDPGPLTSLLGMGAGSYPRVNAKRRPPAEAPTDYWLSRDGGATFLAIRSGATLYFGQKVALRHDRRYRLTIKWRAPEGPAGLSVSLCEKLVLYSTNCVSPTIPVAAGSGWQTAAARFAPHLLVGSGPGWLPARPLELALAVAGAGRRIDIAAVALVDDAGDPQLVNGDFARGLARWAISDDDHWAWRIESEYAAALFDGGYVRLGALLLLLAAAFVGATRLSAAGHPLGPALIAATLTLASTAIFDQPLQTPRLAALFYLALFAALFGFDAVRATRAPAAGEDPAPVAPPGRPRRRRRSRSAAAS